MTLAVALQTGDWAVLVAYVLLLLAAGWFLARREAKDTKGYFLAARSMPAWAVAISILATAQSAATYIGAPEKGWSGDVSYLLANLGVIVAAIVVSVWFLPVYYRLNVQTPYELLESTCGRAARRTASVWYLLGRFMASGVRVYIGALPFCLAVFGEVTPLGLIACIAGFMAFGALFTLAGGVRAAIWSDVLQVGVYIGSAVVLLLVLLGKIPLHGEALWHALMQGSANADGTHKGLTLIGPLSDNLNPAKPFTVLTGLTGWALLNIAFFAMDQDLTQRLLACKDSKAAAKSLLINTVAVTLPVVGLFCLLGLLMGVYYTRADVMGVDGLPLKPGSGGGSTDALVDFASLHAPAGVLGLMLAGVLAAGPAGINSSLNSMASSVVADLYRPARPGRDERHYVVVGRVATVACGVVMGVFAAFCVQLQGRKDLIDFALGVMPYAYAGLLGVFAAAVFLRRVPVWFAVASMPAGLVAVLAVVRCTDWTTPWQLIVGSAVSFAVCLIGWAGRRAT
jgi:SSS family transporter